MSDWRTLEDIRREYGELSLTEDQVADDPYVQFTRWFQDVLAVEKNDPTAMVLSTVDSEGWPDSRVVLLKGMMDNGFVFYTNYDSQKALQLTDKPYAALNFYWAQMARQVRIRGLVTRCSAEQSDKYFSSRPVASQLSALASPQSREIPNRKYLEDAFNRLVAENIHEKVMRPTCWGGFILIASEIEFWQGRDNRLHDRIMYKRGSAGWIRSRLAP